MTDVVSLDQVRAHLRMPDAYTADDNMLSSIFIPAATSVVNREAGQMTPADFDEFHRGGDYIITVRHPPILAVTFLEEDHGFEVVPLVEQVSTSTDGRHYAFAIDKAAEGVISRRSLNNARIPFWPGSASAFM